MNKVYYIMHNVGKSKYVLNFHDGVQTHKDGSPFFGINIFKNKKKLKKEINALVALGYKERSFTFS
jgi:hypothetical protein